MMKRFGLTFFTLAIVTGLAIGGLMLAEHKPLWGDEVYSQVASIEGLSYAQIIAGKIGEGNASPLFYLTQKVFCDLTGYHAPQEWIHGNWTHNYPYSNILLRALPLVWMSSAIGLIFYFFGRSYGIWTGLYSLAVAMSSFMVWAYAFEARPYALWFFLTTIQVLLFLGSLKERKFSERTWKILVLIHCLLALTVMFSMIQVSAMCILLWFLAWKDWRKYIGLWLVPVVVMIFYYIHSAKLKFWFAEGFMGLIGASLPQDRLLILGIFGLFWVLTWGASRHSWPAPAWFKGIDPAPLRLTGYYGLLTIMILAGYLGALTILKLTAGAVKEGFQVSNRYFITLASLGIIGVTLFSHYLISSQKGFWRVLLLAFLIILLLWRVFRTLALVLSLHMF